MKTQKSLMYRVGSGKVVGLIFGLLGFYLLPMFVQDSSLLLRTGILLWYPTLGAIIGLFGVLNQYPILGFSMPWWFRGAVVGGWMNFILTLFAFEQICVLSSSIFGEYSIYVSPFWMVLEGALIGSMIDYLLTHWFGDGWSIKQSRKNELK